MVNIASIVSGAIAASSLAGLTVAHPGEKHDLAHVKRELDARQLRATAAKRSLAQCEHKLKHRVLMQRSLERRAQIVKDLRQKRSIQSPSQKWRRDLASLQEFETINHNYTGIYDYDTETNPNTIFSANTSSILTPEVTAGPFYVTGEYLRKNVKEDQVGIDMYLEIQYIDVTTCEPVPELYVDIWGANATGVYSGVEYGQAGLNSTFLRGVQATDEDGVVAYETIFPGHYNGRAVHTHLLTKSNVTVRENGTTGTDGAVTHIGQLFFPEELIAAVEATAPYNTNKMNYTSNDEDMWSAKGADNDYDPFPHFVYLGDDITDGLLAWIQIGINSTADHTNDQYYQVDAYYQEGGGVANPNFTLPAGLSAFLPGATPPGTTLSKATTPSGSASTAHASQTSLRASTYHA